MKYLFIGVALVAIATMARIWYMSYNVTKYIAVKPFCYDYQVDIQPDSAYIYDMGKLVGVCAHGNDGIDSVIQKDNE